MKTLAGFAMVVSLCAWTVGCSKADVEHAAGTMENAAATAGDAATELGEQAEGAMAAVGEEFTAATEQASEALQGVEGGSELLTKIKELFASATTTLSGVTDEATANAAVPKLGELSLSAEGIKPLLDKLPESAQTAVVGLIEKGLPKLDELAKKAFAIPGVEAVLKPKLDELLGQLKGLTGKPA